MGFLRYMNDIFIYNDSLLQSITCFRDTLVFKHEPRIELE